MVLSEAIEPWAFIELGVVPGTPGAKRYGPDPLTEERLFTRARHATSACCNRRVPAWQPLSAPVRRREKSAPRPSAPEHLPHGRHAHREGPHPVGGAALHA